MGRSCTVSGSIGGALLVALLLTGCGGEGDGAAASPSSTASSTASAGSTPAEPASPVPSPEGTPAEYVPASLEGPAQNVPKPVMPELAKEESRAGVQAFLDYWSDAMWYAYQTGDTSYARKIISPHCEACIKELDDVESVYVEGNWMIGGRPTLHLQESQLSPASDGVYKPRAIYSGEGGKLIEKGVLTQESGASEGESTLVYLDFIEKKWVYITMAPVAGE